MDDGAAAAFPVPQKVSSVKWCGALCKGDPQVVVAGSHDSDQCCLYFYDVNDSKGTGLTPEPLWAAAHPGAVRDVQVAPTPEGAAQLVVAASAWGLLSVYEARWDNRALLVQQRVVFGSGDDRSSVHPTQRGRAAINSIALLPTSPHLVAVASAAGTLSLLDLSASAEAMVALTPSPVTKVVCRDPHGAELLTLQHRVLSVWDTRTLDRPTLSCQAAGPHRLTAVTAHPTVANTLVVGDQGGGIALWDVRAGATAFEAIQTPLQPAGSMAAVWHLQFAKDRLLTGDGAGSLDLWTAPPAAPSRLTRTRRLRRGPLPVVSFDVHPLGGTVCAAVESYALFLYDLEDGADDAMLLES
jgi:hypothetical protein